MADSHPDPDATLPDPTVCEGEPDDFGDTGCHGRFKHKSATGKCAKCTRIAEFIASKRGDADIERLVATPQCTACGIVCRVLNTTGVCRGCAQRDGSGTYSNDAHAADVSRDAERRASFSSSMIDAKARRNNQRPSQPTGGMLDDPPHAASRVTFGQAPRTSALHARGPLAPTAGFSYGHQASPTIVHNSETMRALRSGTSGTGLSPDVTVAFIPIYKRKEVGALGIHTASHPSQRRMYDVKATGLSMLNTVWVTKSSYRLRPDDVRMTICGNQTIPPTQLEEYVGDFFNRARTGTGAEQVFCGPQVPVQFRARTGAARSRIKVLPLELHIDIAGWEEHTNAVAPFELSQRTGKKRKAEETQSTMSLLAGGLSSRMPPSLFGRQPRTSRQKRSRYSILDSDDLAFQEEAAPQSVRLQYATPKMDEYGHVTFLWDDEECEGKLATQPIAQGQMKKIYELDLDDRGSDGYVAKRFFDVGRGPDMVSIRDNSQYLELDAIRLVYTKFFIKTFYEVCVRSNFKDFAPIGVTRFRLAREVIPPNGQPSIASDVSLQQLAKAPSGMHIMWLVEPRRNTQTTRWSGTMAHPRHSSLAGNTVTALAHMAYGMSNKTMVLADLQSTEGIRRRGAESSEDGAVLTNILFDVMTHTAGSSDHNVSGLGDHGQEGVDCFLREHFCGPVCEQLQVEAWIKDLDNADPQEDDTLGAPEDGGDALNPAQSLHAAPKEPRSLTPSTADGHAGVQSPRTATSSGA